MKTSKTKKLKELADKVGEVAEFTVNKWVYNHSSKSYLINFHNDLINCLEKQKLSNKKRGKSKIDRKQHLRIVTRLVKKYTDLIDKSFERVAEWKYLGKDMKKSTIKINWDKPKKPIKK